LRVAAEKLGRYDSKLVAPDYKKNPTPYAFLLGHTISTLAKLDFTSERKTMSTVVKGFHGVGNSLLLKGAPERVIEKCQSYKNAEGEIKALSPEGKVNLIKDVNEIAKQGLRCLGIAALYDAGSLSDLSESNKEDKLSDLARYGEYETGGTFLGIMCIKDPVRAEVKGAIADCKTAGIRVIMITGDSKETAEAIAKEVDIIDANSSAVGHSFTGEEFELLSQEAKLKALGGAGGKVFSRVEPRHKRELVKLLISMVSSYFSENTWSSNFRFYRTKS
jgi:magnesium-transporting ATPase (P-type)